MSNEQSLPEVGYSAVLIGRRAPRGDFVFEHPKLVRGGTPGNLVFEHAVLTSPHDAMRWLDERLLQHVVKPAGPRVRRALLRRLRGDLRCRDQWLCEEAPRSPYVVTAETRRISVEACLHPVPTLLVLNSCLLLEVAQ